MAINSPLKEYFILNIASAWQHVPCDVKKKIEERKKKKIVCYLVCQSVCVFYVDTTLRAEPNMVALPNLTWLSVKQAGTLAYDCFLLCHLDWCFVLRW